MSTTTPRTILVVDDDPAIRKVLSLGLERMGYQVRLATNGREGLDFLEAILGEGEEIPPYRNGSDEGGV